MKTRKKTRQIFQRSMTAKNVAEETLNRSTQVAFQINCFIFALVNIQIIE